MIPEVKLGSALVSLLDPTPGEEVAFHRWYERDHFYSGVMFGSWFFAGRRFVATRRLKDLRFPPETPVIDDVMKGSYLALYWITGGRHAEAEAQLLAWLWRHCGCNSLHSSGKVAGGACSAIGGADQQVSTQTRCRRGT